MSGVIKIAKLLLLPLLASTIVAGFFWLPPAKGFLNEGLARIVVFHVPCSIVATVASVVATWHAIAYLRTRDYISDIKSRVSFGFALMLWALTTVTGAIFARVQWGVYWNWDIKQTAILILLMVYAAYFALRSAIDDDRKSATLGAVYVLFALVAMPYLTLILPNSTDQTLHPKGTLTSRDGLSPAYSITLWAGVVGLTGVYLWASRIATSVAVLELNCRRRASEEDDVASKVLVVEQVR